MNLEQEHQQQLAGLRQSLETLMSIKVEDLVRTEQLGSTLDFRDGIPVFERTLQLFGKLSSANLDGIPASVLSQLQNSVVSAMGPFQRILQFDPTVGNPASERDSLIQQIRDEYDSYFQQVIPTIAYSAQRGTDFELLEKQARDSVNEIRDLKVSFAQERQEIVDNARDALSQVREAAANVGVAQHAVHFKEETVRHAAAKERWLTATIALAALVFAVASGAIYYYMTSTVERTTAQLVQLGLAKVFLFSILSYVLVWTARMYRAESHNLVVNQHRQNALKTFETFVAASGDESTKSAVLLQATQCIFSHQATGFVQHEQEVATSPKVLEIVRSMIPSSGPS